MKYLIKINLVDISYPEFRLSNKIDKNVLWEDLVELADERMEGRKTGTHGGKLAAQYIFQRYQQIGLKTFPSLDVYFQNFNYSSGWVERSRSNVVAWLKGNKTPQEFIVVTAHYDHLGSQGKKIFNGADDNATGVAALLSIAQYIAVNGSQYSIVFVATDAEEAGLYGALAFLTKPPISIHSISYNLNLDMLGIGGKPKKLYVTPSRNHQGLRTVIQNVINKAGLCLVKRHRSRPRSLVSRKHINWRLSSDHGAFSKRNIPYLFVGVADHFRYHTVNDTLQNIDRQFFTAAAETALSLLLQLDATSD